MCYFESAAGLIEIVLDDYDVYNLYIGGVLYDTSRNILELKRCVEEQDTGCERWDDRGKPDFVWVETDA